MDASFNVRLGLARNHARSRWVTGPCNKQVGHCRWHCNTALTAGQSRASSICFACLRKCNVQVKHTHLQQRYGTSGAQLTTRRRALPSGCQHLDHRSAQTCSHGLGLQRSSMQSMCFCPGVCDAAANKGSGNSSLSCYQSWLFMCCLPLWTACEALHSGASSKQT